MKTFKDWFDKKVEDFKKKEFNVLPSEIKKAESIATKRNGRKTQVTGWASDVKVNEDGFCEVRFEMCSNNMEDREDDVYMCVCVFDRRRSFVWKIG